jgi:hypothetical protein
LQRNEFFALQKTILERLFPDKWFDLPRPNHPAYRRWKLCDDILKHGGAIRYPEQKESFAELARLVLDAAVFVTLTEGDMNQLKVGSLDLYGDNAVRRFIQTRITEADLFEDVMVQLAFGAWHKSEKHVVTPSEKEGFPDLEISIPPYTTPFVFECKRVKSGTKNKIRKVITKANAQIKVPGKVVYGIATVDVSDVVGTLQVENDEVPSIVTQVASFARSALGNEFNRSVGAVILLWDDFLTYGKPPEKTLIAFRRRYMIIRHPVPLLEVPLNAPLFNGYTVEYTVSWEPRPDFNRYALEFRDLYTKESKQEFNISPEEAADAIRKNNRYQRIVLEGGKSVFLFAYIPPKKNDAYLLVYANEEGDKLVVMWAFMISTSLCPEIHLLSPLQILERFAGQFGLPLRVGQLESKFILAHRIEVTGSAKVFEIVNPENHDFMTCFLLRIDKVDKHSFANCRLMFCIDKPQYLTWLKGC